MAHWHGLAKMRMHNDLTLEVMDKITVSLGEKLCKFSLQTCPAFQTKELYREFDACVRCEARKSPPKKGEGIPSDTDISMEPPTAIQRNSANIQHMLEPGSNAASDPTFTPAVRNTSSNTQPQSAGRRHKTFNLSTYALHSIGDYVKTIQQYGTTDSFSTEPVSCLSNAYANC